MKKGSHDTMTYLPPKKWWMRLGRFIYRCQTKSLKDQLKTGISLVDLRVRFDKNHNPYFCHGIYEADGYVLTNEEFVNTILDTIKMNRCNDGVFYIRLILELSKDDYIQELNFVKLVREFQKKISDDIILFGGFIKHSWRKVVDIPDYPIKQMISSMADDARWYEKICPILYAKRMNKTNLNKFENSEDIVLFDFI